MQFPEPAIDVKAATYDLQGYVPIDGEWIVPSDTESMAQALQQLLAQAWEEGRWSPPGPCLNPYGAPAEPLVPNSAEEWPPGQPLRALRAAAREALDWIEESQPLSPLAPTARRTALASQLRDALGGK